MKKFFAMCLKRFLSLAVLITMCGLFLTSCEEETVEGIYIQGCNPDVNVGDSGVLDIDYYPDYLEKPVCNWVSSDSSIVEIDYYSGEYKVKNVGVAVITVMTSDMSLMDQIEFHSSVHRNCSMLSSHNELLYEGLEIPLSLNPYYYEYLGSMEWLSTDNSIATVDEEGKVTAVAPGNCYIVCIVRGYGLKDYCKISVEKFCDVESIEFDFSEKELELGSSCTLNVKFIPSNATIKNIEWISLDTTIVAVDETGLVTTISEGETTVIAKAYNGVTAECKITVLPVPVESVELSASEVKMLVGDYKEIKYNVTPYYARINSVEWEVDNEDIVSVSDGVIVAKQLGETTVRVIVNEEYVAECRVRVCDINEFVSVGVSYSSINGVAIGGINTWLYNNSSRTIVAKSIQVIDGVYGHASNVMELGDDVVSAYSSTGYTITTGRNYFYPICRWVYTYEGEEYIVDGR